MICGIEIKSNEAILVLVKDVNGMTDIVQNKIKRIALDPNHDHTQMRQFMATAESFFKENGVSAVVIKERADSGPAQASGITFKIEALIQLSHKDTVLVHGNTLRKFAKTNAGGIPAGAFAYQKDAYLAGAWLLKK